MSEPEFRSMTLAEMAGIHPEDEGEPWIPVCPCTEAGRPRLYDFLYILCRDHLPVGDVEMIMFDQVDTEPSSYCNTYLEEYARDLADRLLDLERPITEWKHMYKSADGKEKWIGKKPEEVT